MKRKSVDLSGSAVAILWDWQNVRATQQQEAERCINFARQRGTILYKEVYAHWRHESSRFEELLDNLDFDCFNVPSSKSKKNNVDKKLIKRCHKYILNNPAITTVVLLSGDKDFTELVDKLKAKGKKVVVITKNRSITSNKLVQHADEFKLLASI